MKSTLFRSAGLIVLGITNRVLAHTWVEELRVIANNGTMVGDPGYSRGNVLRTSPTFSDTAMVWLLPPDGGGNAFTSDMKVCRPSQTVGNQTPGSPALKASPGDMIALRYQENGHVTLPDTNPGKPANRGTVFIYGTTQPSSSDTYLGVKQWTADGKGGDGRGVLLATRNYDDGQCYQVNGGTISTQRQQQFAHTSDPTMGTNLWCQSDVQIPASTKASGAYTLYWVWDWATAPGTVGLPNGKNQSYTTCMDVELSPASNSGSSKAAVAFAEGQSLNNAAIQGQLENPFLVPVSGASNSGSDSGSGTASSPAAPAPSVAAGNGNGAKVVTVTEQVTEKVTVTHTIYGPSPTASAVFTSIPAASPISEGVDGSAPAASAPVAITHVTSVIMETFTITSHSPTATAPALAATSAAPNVGVGEGENGTLTVSPFLDVTAPSAPKATTPSVPKPNTISVSAPSPAPTTVATEAATPSALVASNTPVSASPPAPTIGTPEAPTPPAPQPPAPQPTTLATQKSSAPKSIGPPPGVAVTTVDVVKTETFTRHAAPSPAPAPTEAANASVKIKGRWVVVSATWA